MSYITINGQTVYDGKERWAQIEQTVLKDFGDDIIECIVDGNFDSPINHFIGISKLISQLEKDINDLKPDGNEERYLKFEDRCLDLFKKLDAISLEKRDEENEMKRLVRKLKDLGEIIKDSLIINLKKLLAEVRCLDRTHFSVYREIDCFLENQIKSSTIREIDIFRDKLEDIRNK